MKAIVAHRKAREGGVIRVEFGSRAYSIFTPLCRPEPETYDFALWHLMLLAMRAGLSIELDRPVCEDTLFNLAIIQSFLAPRPNLSRISITAPSVAIKSPRSAATLIPFSGGVDSCFTLFYHTFSLGRAIDNVLLVQGLDVFDDAEYALYLRRCHRLLEGVRASPIPVRTNVRSRTATDLGWKLHSDFVLGGLLQAFQASHGNGFISGGGDAGLLSVRECLETPFLSERLFFLFSSDRMLIQNFEGSNRTKIQKVAYINAYPEVRRNLRVCWQKGRHDNCGQCQKCVITQLYFLAVSGEIPPCFESPMSADSLRLLLREVAASKAMDPDGLGVIGPKEFKLIVEESMRSGHRSPFIDIVADFLLG